MNWNQIEGQWDQFKGQLKSKWGKFTDDDMTNLAGKKDQIVGRFVERYGVKKDEAEKKLDEWIKSL